MSDVTIGRLAIRLHGDAELGGRLAQLVAERLAGALALAPGEASLERLNLEIAEAPDESLDALAMRIADAVALGAVR
jgi:hypothetical protein